MRLAGDLAVDDPFSCTEPLVVVGGVTEAWLLRCSAREAAADSD